MKIVPDLDHAVLSCLVRYGTPQNQETEWEGSSQQQDDPLFLTTIKELLQ